MRSKLMSLLTVIGAVTVLVLAANTVALATTGKAILAGKSNTANAATGITRTTVGPALSVKTKSNANAPFAVNGTGKVVNLNVDKVDGLDGGTRALTWSFAGNVDGNAEFKLNGLPAGNFLVSYSAYFASLASADGLGTACYLRVARNVGGTSYTGETSTAETGQTNVGLSATALVAIDAGGAVTLACNTPSDATWSAPSNEPVRITAIPIAGVTNKGVPTLATRVAARR